MERYYYLAYSLFFVGVFGVVLWKRRDLLKAATPLMILGALLGPISEYLYTRDYWRPDMLASWGHVSLENVAFGLALCGLAATLYPALKAKKVIMPRPGGLQHARFFAAGLGSLGLIAGLSIATGHNSLITATMVYFVLWALLLGRQPRLAAASIVTSTLCTVLITAVYVVGLNVVEPSYLQHHWLLYGTPLGVTVLGNIPLSEIFWFGAVTGYLSSLSLYHYSASYEPAESRLSFVRLLRTQKSTAEDSLE